MRLIPRVRRRDPSRAMTVIQHLEELRTRVFISFIVVALAAIAGWLLFPWVFKFLLHSYKQACEALPKANRPPIPCGKVVAQSVLEPFLVRFKVSVFSGFAIALPVVLFQLWRFITPGLTRQERRLTVPFILSSILLFALGGFFAFWTLPRGLSFLLGFGGANLVVLPEATKYISFVLLLTLAFGLSFEFPLVLIFLAWVGLVSSAKLRQWRRYAILFIVIFAAVITPSQDPFTLLAMSVPMVVFYEATIWITRLMKR